MKKLTHIHHILPRHMGGTDDPSNLIELTIEEHAKAHEKLYEEHGKYEDFLAWKMLSGQISGVEAHRLAIIHSNKTRVYSPETREKLAKAMRGKKLSEETKQKMRISAKGKNKGKTRTPETCKKISDAKLGKPLNVNRLGQGKETYQVQSPTGDIFEVRGLMEFCKTYQLPQPSISKVVRGIHSHYKGWVVTKLASC